LCYIGLQPFQRPGFPLENRWRTPLNTYILVFISSFLLALGLTPLFRRIALKTQFVDNPTGQLMRHTAPVPYLGGLAVYSAFLLTSWVFGPSRPPRTRPKWE